MWARLYLITYSLQSSKKYYYVSFDKEEQISKGSYFVIQSRNKCYTSMPQWEYLTLIPPLFPKTLNYADYVMGHCGPTVYGTLLAHYCCCALGNFFSNRGLKYVLPQKERKCFSSHFWHWENNWIRRGVEYLKQVSKYFGEVVISNTRDLFWPHLILLSPINKQRNITVEV